MDAGRSPFSPRLGISETVSAFASLKAMLPLQATLPKAVERSEKDDKNRQVAGEAVTCILDSRARNVAPDAQANIHRALAILRADLKVVQEAIQALESIAPEAGTEGFCGPSTPRPVTPRTRKPRKVVDIHTKRA
jgi:hypothetical protein